MSRFFFNCFDYQNDIASTFRACFNHVGTLINAGQNYNRMVLLAGQNDSMESIRTLMAQHFGMEIINGASRIPVIPLNVVFSTVRRYNVAQGASDLVISCDLDSKELLKLEGEFAFGITDNIEVRQYADIALWGGTWGVANPGNPGSSFAQLNPHPIVQHALDQISQAINLGNRTVFHPSDDELVKTCVLALNHHMGFINTDEVFAYVIRNRHWPVGLAYKLVDYIDRLNNGRIFHGGDRHRTRMNNLIARWRQ